LQNTLDLARFTDEIGYERYWLAEHHNTSLLASPAPEVMIGHVAGVTKRIRVGSGGIMLPNHSPLKVAETFRLLEALHPGRIELGIGRAPGTDQMTALALRRARAALAVDDFPQQLAELLAFFSGSFPAGHPFSKVRAIPDDVPPPRIWLLGSSDFSARLAAQMGLGFAFAHHISPSPAVEALRLYHEQFRPSEYFAEPDSILAVSAICAETDDLAHELASSAELTLLRFQKGNHQGTLPGIAEAKAYPYTGYDREIIEANRARLFAGSPSTIRDRLSRLAERAGVREIMITTMIHEHALRRRSYALLADAFALSRTALA
jgi:luciferase family oxidoreductase group 1